MDALTTALKKAQRGFLILELTAPNGEIFRFAEKDITVESAGDPQLYRCALLTPLAVSTSFDFRTPSYSVSRVSVKLVNRDRLQDADLDGARARIFLWAEGLSFEDMESQGLLFAGSMAVESYDRFSLSATLTDDTADGLGTIPAVTVSADTWPNHRTEGGGGSAAGQAAPVVLGDFARGVPLVCVDTASFKYLVSLGFPKSTDADYSAVTEAVYDKNGTAIGAANYTFSITTDGRGNLCAVFTFISDRADNEPLSCSIKGISDKSGKYAADAGSVITHPADITHYMLAASSKLPESRLDAGAFKTLRSALPNVKFGAVINEAANVKDVAARFLAQCQAALVARKGKIGAVGLFPQTPVKAVLNAKDAHARSVSFAKTPADTLANSITVKFAYNASQRAYEGAFTLDKSNNEACERGFNRYGQKAAVLELPDARDEETAKQLAARFAELNALRRDLLTVTVPVWEGVGIVEGDAAGISSEDGPSVDGSGWAEEHCILVERSITGQAVKQKWWRSA